MRGLQTVTPQGLRSQSALDATMQKHWFLLAIMRYNRPHRGCGSENSVLLTHSLTHSFPPSFPTSLLRSLPPSLLHSLSLCLCLLRADTSFQYLDPFSQVMEKPIPELPIKEQAWLFGRSTVSIKTTADSSSSADQERDSKTMESSKAALGNTFVCFHKLGVPFVAAHITRALLLGGLYWGPPLGVSVPGFALQIPQGLGVEGPRTRRAVEDAQLLLRWIHLPSYPTSPITQQATVQVSIYCLYIKFNPGFYYMGML